MALRASSIFAHTASVLGNGWPPTTEQERGAAKRDRAGFDFVVPANAPARAFTGS